jgi:hypothetical protein
MTGLMGPLVIPGVTSGLSISSSSQQVVAERLNKGM